MTDRTTEDLNLDMQDVLNEARADVAEDVTAKATIEDVKTESEGDNKEAEKQSDKKDAEPPVAEEKTVEKSETQDPETKGQLAALMAERQKGKKLKEELETARHKITQYEQKADDVPDPTTDPMGYQKFMGEEKNIEANNNRIAMSADMMRGLKDDYQDMEALFLTLKNTDAMLDARMRASKHPALFAYQIAKEHHDKLEAQKVTREEELKASMRVDFLKEFGIKDTDEQRNKTALSTPNLTQTSSQSESTQIAKPVNPTDISDMFEDSP